MGSGAHSESAVSYYFDSASEGLAGADGGGAVLRPENRQVLRDFGNVLYLRASPEEIFKRVKHDRTRPLLQVNNPLQKLRELYAQRDALYREAATYVIETGRPTVQTLVNMIMMQLEMAPPRPRQQAPQKHYHHNSRLRLLNRR